MQKTFSASLMLALAAPFGALAQTTPNAEITALRQEMQAIRAAYEARLQALEQRLQAAEASAAAGGANVANTANAARAANTANAANIANSASVAAPVSAAPAPAAVAGASANAFNPALSLILSGQSTHTSRDPATYAIAGWRLPPGAEIGPGSRGFGLAETELAMSASIDPFWRGAAFIALHPDNSVSVEEAYVQTTSLGRGLGLKVGRFFSNVGYLNPQHAHTWDFVDNPLAYQAMLGTQYGDDGLQVSWLAPTERFIELGLEVGRGRGFPGSDTSRNGAGMTALAAHSGGDIGDSHSWRAGLSMLDVRASALGLGPRGQPADTVAFAFDGRTRVWIADAVWKWAPNGNASRVNFKLQGEFLRSTRSGSYTDLADGGRFDARGVQSGWYLQAIYQFMPGWRVGLRTERLDPGAADHGADVVAADSGLRPRKQSLMLDYKASEFSRLRLQWAQDRARPGAADRQFFVQYQMSLGAHAAHAY